MTFLCDLKLCTSIKTNLDNGEATSEASSGKKKRGGRHCISRAPNNTSCTNNSYTVGISKNLHASVSKESGSAK